MKLFEVVDDMLVFGSRYVVHVAIITSLVGFALLAVSWFTGLSDVPFTGALKGASPVAVGGGASRSATSWL